MNRTQSRRRFLRTAALSTGAVALGSQMSFAARRNKVLPKPQNSGIQHIIVMMMENRSFDHFMGWLPGANGRQAGLSYPDRNGVLQPTYPLATDAITGDFQGCDHPDPEHSYQGGRVEYDGGKCDGWLQAGQNDLFAIGYYQKESLSFLGNAAPAWTVCDQYFSPIMASTYPNRFYMHAAQTDRLDNSLTLSTLPTIWDRMADHSLPARYYFSDVPFVALWGAKYLPITRHITEFFADCAAGTLPAVSFVDPRLLGEEQGLSNDDHPHADIRNGEVLLNAIYNAVISSPNWGSTVLVLTFDEWGGFFDHVPPSRAPIPAASAAAGDRDGLRGFRVPTLLISPWSTRGFVDHGIYDHTSVLKMIEWRWHLEPLTVRDSSANNIAEALDFSRRNLSAPLFNVPTGPFGVPCVLQETLTSEWELLATAAQAFGF